MSVSAYMIAHCDDDYLAEAIASIIDHVDELVFVDGAYAWVAPFLPDVGIDPERSWQSTYDILARYGGKVKVFTGVWQDELEKRAFGFAQCSGDFIIRIDADEVFTLDAGAFFRFRWSGRAMADMEFPYLLTGDRQRLQDGLAETPRQVCAFRRRAFATPYEHCAYLWLVLTDAERSRCPPADGRKRVYRERVAKTAHLTALRTPRTSVNRARYYTLQHIRSTGEMPFGLTAPEGASGDERIALMLEAVGAETYSGYLEGHAIVSGFTHMDGFHIAPYALPPAAADVAARAVETRHRAMADMLDFATRPRLVINGIHTIIDVTPALKTGMTGVTLTFSDDIVHAAGHFELLSGDRTAGADRLMVGFITTVDGNRVRHVFAPVEVADVLQATMVLLTQAAPDAKVTRLVDIAWM